MNGMRTKSNPLELIVPYADALATYKAQQGHNWQQQLRDDWLSDNRRQWGILRALRNDARFGGFAAVFAAFDAYQVGRES